MHVEKVTMRNIRNSHKSSFAFVSHSGSYRPADGMHQREQIIVAGMTAVLFILAGGVLISLAIRILNGG